MDMRSIPSTNLAEVGFDEQSETMEVVFDHAGERYRFFNITPTTFEAMMNANTPGKYFYHHIRLSYPYVQIG